MQSTEKKLIITGSDDTWGGAWVIINHPSPEKTDYLLINAQGFTFYKGPAEPMKNGAWAKIPMQRIPMSRPQVAELLAEWFADAELDSPITGAPGHAHCRTANVQICRYPGSLSAIEITPDHLVVFDALGEHHDHVYSTAHIAQILHRWFKKG